MELEKKFSVDLRNKEYLVSASGSFSNVYKIRDENGKVYCGKLPKRIQVWNHMLPYDPLGFKDKFSKSYLQRFTNCALYGGEIAKDIWNRFDLAMKPEGVYDVKIDGVKDFFLPTFVNELAVDMDPSKLSGEDFDNVYVHSQDEALKIVLGEGYYVGYDVEAPFNCFYSKDRGFKFNDFGLWGRGQKYNEFLSSLETDNEWNFNSSVKFTQKKKKELGLI